MEKNEAVTRRFNYLPEFCNGDNFLRLLLVVELLAIVFALISYDRGSIFVHIAVISLLMLWVGLGVAATLCLLSRLGWLVTPLSTTIIAVSVTIIMTFAASLLALGFDRFIHFSPGTRHIAFFLSRNLAVAMIMVGLALRYFYLRYQSERAFEVQAQARLQALQARIRPHFLFNSMNTIASLTHDQPDVAELAIENLADLFRASLAAEASIPIQNEIELTRSYISLEKLRLAERLTVSWQTPADEPVCNLPALTLQPLVENAIYHGIEPLAEGGTIDIAIIEQSDFLEISISNPLIPGEPSGRRKGNQMAVDNIRERLLIAYAGDATMTVTETEKRYTVALGIPRGEGA